MTIIITSTIIAIIAVIAIAAILRTDRTVTTPAPVEDAALTPGTTPIAGAMAMRWAREAADRGDIRQAEVYRELAVRMGAERTGYNFWGERI